MDVTFLRYEPSAGVSRAYRWWRGTAVPLTPDLPYGVGSRPSAMDDAGNVVGYRFEYLEIGGPRAFVWRDGATTWFDEHTMGIDIDDRGRVLLNRDSDSDSDSDSDGFGYRAGLVVDGRELTSPYVFECAPIWANALGGHGLVVGSAFSIVTGDRGGFAWRPGDAPVDIGDLGGGWAEPIEVTDDGTVVGYSDTTEDARMFRWRAGHMTDLGTLGGANTYQPYYLPARVDLVNERGDVTGSSEIADGVLHAFRWRNGRMRDLGTLGGAQSYGFGINDDVAVIDDRGRVLGYRDGIAVLWNPPR